MLLLLNPLTLVSIILALCGPSTGEPIGRRSALAVPAVLPLKQAIAADVKRRSQVGRIARPKRSATPACPTFTLVSSDGSGSIISGSGAGGEYIFLSTGSTGAIVFSLTTAGTLTDPQGFMYSADSTGIDTVLRSPSNQRGFDLLQCQATASQQLNCFVGSGSQNNFALLGGTLGLQTSKYNSDYPPITLTIVPAC